MYETDTGVEDLEGVGDLAVVEALGVVLGFRLDVDMEDLVVGEVLIFRLLIPAVMSGVAEKQESTLASVIVVETVEVFGKESAFGA